jgi:hypothetical protein
VLAALLAIDCTIATAVCVLAQAPTTISIGAARILDGRGGI